jgi:folate-dependent phosphoribosylglycinamide formyltransferase PurN
MIDTTSPDKRLRCALLTIGIGPIAVQSYAALKELVDLKCVVLSRKPSRKPLLTVIREFGPWYVFQAMSSILTNRIRRQFISSDEIALAGIRTVVWSGKEDEALVLGSLRELDVEFILVCGFQHILRRPIIDAAKYCFNMHPSLLPAYRGPEPIVWGLLCKEKSFGITIHEVDERVDQGDIVAQGAIASPALPLQAAVESELSRLVPDMLDKVVKSMNAGNLLRQKQGKGTYLPAPSYANRKLFIEGHFDD